MFISAIMPLLYALTTLLDFEPTHVLILDVLEIDLKANQFSDYPILFIMALLIVGLSITSFIAIIIVICYFILAKSCLIFLTPERIKVQPRQLNSLKTRTSYIIQNRYLGLVDESTFIILYRQQQVFNKMFNQIFACVLCSCHHVTYLFSIVGLTTTLIVAYSMLLEAGIAVLVIWIGAIIMICYMLYVEVSICGTVSNLSTKL